MKKPSAPVWVAVKIERGYVSEARLCGTRSSADRVAQKWRRRLNPDYDEADVVQCQLHHGLKRRLITPR